MRLFGRSKSTGTGVVNAELVADHLAQLLRFPTVAPDRGEEPDEACAAAFEGLHAKLREFYPLAFAAAEIDRVGDYGLLLRFAGASAEEPVLLMAHQDVVPTSADWEAEGWPHDPFAGVIEDGRVYGRGTLDDKGALVVMMEALESLLIQGWEPARDLYVLMGADEEKYGTNALDATELLRERGVVPHLVLDEGGAVAAEVFPGIKKDVAVVGVSEKGLMSVELIVDDAGGHASTPPIPSAPTVLAQALLNVDANQMPAVLHEVSRETFVTLAPYMPFLVGRMVKGASRLRKTFTNLLLKQGPETAAMARTTFAITQLEGSPGMNVLATRAKATLNIRVAVGVTTDEVIEHLTTAIADERVAIEVLERNEPSPVSPRDERFDAIGAAVENAYPGTPVAPYIMLAASDGRHLATLSPAVYRFSPLRMDKAQRAAVHGIDENVEVASLGRGVEFYRSLLTGAALGPGLK